jgi:hypothetical protein
MNMKTAALVSAIALAGALSACETATPYQPLQKGSTTSGGFSDQSLDANHFGVTFEGNYVTSRQTVETYLLYRAAQLTLAQGFDWFETVDRHTERDQRTYLYADPFYGPGYAWGYWRPSWRFYGGGFGWGSWGPYWGDPFWANSVQVQTAQKFQASAVIVMGHAPKPPGDLRAFDARAVMTNLGPKIILPSPKS